MIQWYSHDDTELAKKIPTLLHVKIPLHVRVGYLTDRHPDVGYEKLTSDMLVTILAGQVYLYIKADNSQKSQEVQLNEIIHLPQGTEYYFIPWSREVVMQVTPFPHMKTST